MTSVFFEVSVTPADCTRFAELSGDWNPLHTDADHAARSPYKAQVLHGAFSAGLISRLAGMYLPGRDCLLHAMRLKFVAPIVPPTSLVVRGELEETAGRTGRVQATVSDKRTGTRYVEAVYEFGRHETQERVLPKAQVQFGSADCQSRVLVTGASGGLGGAVLSRLGRRGLGISRQGGNGLLATNDYSRLGEVLPPGPIDAIIHCAWPKPDNSRLIDLDARDPGVVDFNLAGPLRQCLGLARLLTERGAPGAALILIGSTFANPGRHNFRMPLYSLAKSMIPTLTKILALEMAPTGQRCLAAEFDVLDGGMNSGSTPAVKLAHADRNPLGELATCNDAAGQIVWLLENRTPWLSGATLTLSGGSLP